LCNFCVRLWSWCFEILNSDYIYIWCVQNDRLMSGNNIGVKSSLFNMKKWGLIYRRWIMKVREMKLLGDLKNVERWCITSVRSQIICSQVSRVVRKLLALAIKLCYLWLMVLLLVTDFGLWVTLHILLSLLSSLSFLAPLPSMGLGHWSISSCHEWNIAIWRKKGKTNLAIRS